MTQRTLSLICVFYETTCFMGHLWWASCSSSRMMVRSRIISPTMLAAISSGETAQIGVPIGGMNSVQLRIRDAVGAKPRFCLGDFSVCTDDAEVYKTRWRL